MTTDRMNAGTVAHPHSTRALKYIAADTYACAPNARLNTPDVLYVSTNPTATSGVDRPGGAPWRNAPEEVRRPIDSCAAPSIAGPPRPS